MLLPRAVVVLLLLAACATTPAPTPVPDPRARLIVARGHGESGVAALVETARALGLASAEITGPLAAASLVDGSVLGLFMPTSPLTEDEKAAVVAFVRRGNSLWVVLDAEARQSLSRTGVNDVLRPFGLGLTPDTPYLHNRGAVAPVGEICREIRQLPYSGGRAVEGGRPFSFLLDADGNRTSIAHGASLEVPGGGRIVVLGEAMSTLFLGSPRGQRLTGTTPADTTYWGKDSASFNREVLGWLARR